MAGLLLGKSKNKFRAIKGDLENNKIVEEKKKVGQLWVPKKNIGKKKKNYQTNGSAITSTS